MFWVFKTKKIKTEVKSDFLKSTRISKNLWVFNYFRQEDWSKKAQPCFIRCTVTHQTLISFVFFNTNYEWVSELFLFFSGSSRGSPPPTERNISKHYFICWLYTEALVVESYTENFGRIVALVQYKKGTHLLHEFFFLRFPLHKFFHGHFPLHKFCFSFFSRPPPPPSLFFRCPPSLLLFLAVTVLVIKSSFFMLCEVHRSITDSFSLETKTN